MDSRTYLPRSSPNFNAADLAFAYGTSVGCSDFGMFKGLAGPDVECRIVAAVRDFLRQFHDGDDDDVVREDVAAAFRRSLINVAECGSEIGDD